MGIAELAVTLIFGVPVIGGLIIALVSIIRAWALKNRELKLQEDRFHMESNLRQNEMNDRLLRADDYTSSMSEVRLLAEEVRQLRKEMSELRRKQDDNS